MKSTRFYVSSMFCGALALGCAGDAGDGSQSATSTSTTSSGGLSGSVTSAPGSATDDTVGDGVPTMGTATSSAPTTATDSSSAGESCTFLKCDDDMLSEFECDNWAQDCPEGQKCAAYISDGGSSWNDLKCVEVIGTDKPGEACTSEDVASGVDSCIKGAMCWEVNLEGVGYCIALCAGSPEAPVCDDPPGLCTISAGGELNLCLPVCDPILQDCLNPTNACYPINNGFTCVPDASGEEGQANDPCEYINVCDPGLMCGDPAFVGMGCPAGSTGCCTPFCTFPGGACPNPDQACVQYFDPVQLPPGDPWLDIGACGVPG